jgi:adenine-specific DNA-methyltransferase
VTERARLGADKIESLPAAIQPLCAQAIEIITSLGFPRAQQNIRSGLTLMALAGLRAGMTWRQSKNEPIGIRPILDVMRREYGRPYAENSRETVRRQTIHQFRDAALIEVNPDNPSRATNSAATVYMLTPEALRLLRAFATTAWPQKLAAYLGKHPSLIERYARQRAMERIRIDLGGTRLDLSPGGQNVLIRDIVYEFCSRFVKNPDIVYIGDAGGKLQHYNSAALTALGVVLEEHGKFPDVIVHDRDRHWLLLIEAVTSHGPVDGKRHDELEHLFGASTASLVFVTAFPDRAVMSRYLRRIDWATVVWCADAPTHMIHFNGDKFLAGYTEPVSG